MLTSERVTDQPPTPPTTQPRPPRRWRAAAGFVLAAFAGAAAVGLVGAVRGGERESPTDVGTQPRLGAVTPEGREMISLVEKGRKATFHARYRATPSGGQGAGQELTLELWRKPPLEREDTLFVTQGARGHSAGFLRPDKATLCTRRNDEPWTCNPLPGVQRSGPEALVSQLSETVARSRVEVRDDTVAGFPVRCFTVAVSGSPAELCLTEEGVSARVSAGGTRIELVSLSEDVPDSVFEPPAPVTDTAR